MSGRANPWRWRKAKPPAFSRFKQPAMDKMEWHRDHADDIELWRGGVRYATVSPDGRWSGCSTGFDFYGRGQSAMSFGRASNVDTAKADCRAEIERLQAVSAEAKR